MKSIRAPDVESAERFNGSEAMLSVRFTETETSAIEAVFTVLLDTGSVWKKTVSIVKDHVEE